MGFVLIWTLCAVDTGFPCKALGFESTNTESSSPYLSRELGENGEQIAEEQ